jgi:hypothetical protein
MPDATYEADNFAHREDQIGQQAAMMGFTKETMELLLDPSLIIERIKRNLMGQVLMTRWVNDEASGTLVPQNYWAQEGIRLLNDEGVSMVVSILDSYINRNTIFTYLKSERILTLLEELAQDLNDLLYAEGDSYDLKENHRNTVMHRITFQVECVLRGSEDGALMNAVTKSWSVRELKGYQGEKKGGIGDLLLAPFKRGQPQE